MPVSKNRLKTVKDYYACKSNELIRKGRYDLSTMQQKAVIYVVCKIKPSDDPRTFYEIPIDELCAVCGLRLDNGGTYYGRIKNSLRELTTPQWVKYEDQSEWTVSWFDQVICQPMSGTIKVRFHEKMWEHLFNLKEKYTQYQLRDVLVFKNKYAIRLYEILRSYCTQQELDNGVEREITMTPEEIREQFCVETYKEWKEFNRNVIQKAVNEINLYNEQMKVEYMTIKNGREVTLIVFKITSPSLEERAERYMRIKKLTE